MFRRLATIAMLSLAVATSAFAAPAKPHHIAIQVDQNDPQVMNLVLNNATNVIEYYRAKNEDVDIDIVAYGPGLHMLRADTSPVRTASSGSRIWRFPSKVQFSACNNTKQGMEKAEGHPITIVPEATVVPSGVVHLMELQEGLELPSAVTAPSKPEAPAMAMIVAITQTLAMPAAAPALAARANRTDFPEKRIHLGKIDYDCRVSRQH